MGNPKKPLNSDDLDKISSVITNSLASKKTTSGLVSLPSSTFDTKDLNDCSFLQKLGTSLENKSYTYDAKLNKKNKSVNYLKKVSISIESKESDSKLRKSLKIGQVVGQGMNVAKDLANLPGNVLSLIHI